MNRKHFPLIVALAIAIGLLSSCRARFYTANRNPVPLFQNQGDLYFDASTNLVNKADLTVGAAVTDNIGVYAGVAGAAQTFGSDSIGEDKFSYRGNMLNLGLGYFISQKQSENFRFEIYGDYGFGNFRNHVTGAHFTKFDGRYSRLGIMPTIGYRSSDNLFAIAYSARFSQLKFFDATVTDSAFWKSDIERFNRRPYYLMLEHALTFRFGGEKLKFQLQLAGYQGLNADKNSTYETAVPYFNLAAIAGVIYELNVKN